MIYKLPGSSYCKRLSAGESPATSLSFGVLRYPRIRSLST